MAVAALAFGLAGGLACAWQGQMLAAVLAGLLSLALAALMLAWGGGWRPRFSSSAQEESEACFQAVFEQAALGILQIEPVGYRIVSVNQRYCAMSGHTAQELQQRRMPQLVVSEELERQLAQLVAGSVQVLCAEHCLRCSNGGLLWVEMHVSLVGPGRPGMLLALVQDISERKHLQQLQQQDHRQLRLLMQRLPVGLAMEDAAGRFALWNDEFVRLSAPVQGLDMEGGSWWSRIFANAAERERVLQRWHGAKARAREALERAENEQQRHEASIIPAYEYVFHGSDGRRRTVALSGLLLDDGCLMVLQDQSQRKAAEEEVRRLAFYDPLTGLPNRRLFIDRLQQALVAGQRRRNCGAVLLLDVDNFKAFNETYGLEHGDVLLQCVGQRLQQFFDPSVTIARQGGDDFVILIEDLGLNPVAAAAQLESEVLRLLGQLREPLDVGGIPRKVTVSIGISMLGEAHLSVDKILRRAEMAMYQAKSLGRNTSQFFDPKLQSTLQQRTVLEHDMREGLNDGQFLLYYQPQVEHGRVVGAEALLRWLHPMRGAVSPSDFVPLAEETGLILPLGEWVLHTACRQLAAWAGQPRFAHLVLAVNVSPRQFRQPMFVDQVLRALAEHGADPHRLKLELTEGLLLSDVDDTIAKMMRLKSYGVGFSLDDFGTGYSSLAYLKRLPLDQLKIDKSFVRDVLTDPNDAAIARTIVALATSLGLHVIAEGVETEAQCQFLESIRCYSWQGYLLSPPVPVAQFESLLLDHAAAQRHPGGQGPSVHHP